MIRILVLNLASSSSSILLNLTLAQHQHASTGSAQSAAVVIFVAYLPPLLLGPRLGAYIDRSLRRSTLMTCESLTALASLAAWVALVIGLPTALLLSVVAVRSLLTTTVRSSFVKWLKVTTPNPDQARAMQLFEISILISLTLAGIVVGLASLTGSASLLIVLLAEVVLYLCSLSTIAQLDDRPRSGAVSVSASNGKADDSAGVGLRQTYVEICADPVLARHFLIVCLAQALFQGFEQVVVAVGGIGLAGGGMGTALLQIAASAGLVGGVVLLWWFPQILLDSPGRITATGAAGLVCLLGVSQSGRLLLVVPAFAVMTATYELIDLNSTSQFFRAVPEAHAARYSLTMATVGGTIMSVGVLVLGSLIDLIGFPRGTLTFVALYLLAATLWGSRVGPARDVATLPA